MADGEMTTAEAARYLETTQGYLANMRTGGRGPAYRRARSGRLSYLPADLDRWDAERQARRTPKGSPERAGVGA